MFSPLPIEYSSEDKTGTQDNESDEKNILAPLLPGQTILVQQINPAVLDLDPKVLAGRGGFVIFPFPVSFGERSSRPSLQRETSRLFVES